MKKLHFYFVLILILVASIVTFLCTQGGDRGYIVEIGQAAPDFMLTTTTGDEFKLSEKKGKVVMIQFTASWCGVCRKEMPHIEKEIWLKHKEKDFVLIGVDLDESTEVVSEFANKMKITYPLAPDPNGNIFYQYAKKEAGITRNVIVDRDGKIVFLTRLYEQKEFNEMKDVIEELLALPAYEI